MGGAFSAGEELANMVLQGIVLGPMLWNIMYEDARRPLTECNFTELVYADDLNGWKEFGRNIDNATMGTCKPDSV